MAESHDTIEVQETDESGSVDGCGKWNLWMWKSDKDTVVSEFLKESSLHGLKYIGQPKRHIVERIFWIATFVVGLAAAGYLINGVFSRYEGTPVIVSFQSKEQSVNTIPFPAVTFCYNLQFSKENVESLIRIRDSLRKGDPEFEAISEKLDFINGTCQTKKSTFRQHYRNSRFYEAHPRNTYYYHKNQSKLQENIIDFLLEFTPSCEDLIQMVTLDGEYLWRNVFNPVITEFGKCCTFNMLPTPIMLKQPSAGHGNKENIFSNPVLGTRSKKWWNQADIDDWQKWSYEKGFMLFPDRYKTDFIHEKLSHPYRNQRLGKRFGLSVYINTSEPHCDEATAFHGTTFMLHNPVDNPRVSQFPSAIGLEQEVFIKINPDITLADPDIRDLKIEKRQCVFGKEKMLTHFRPYTQENCFQSCIADLIERMCGCSLFYMPRANVTVLCEQNRWENENNCVEETMGYLSNKETCGHCLPLCEYIDYNFEMTNAKLLNWYEGGLYPERVPRRRRSVVHIFYVSPSTAPKLRKRLYGYTDLIANTGGILGLCLGFSVLSGAEVLYYVLMRTIWQIISRRWVTRNTKTTSPSSNAATIKLKNPVKPNCPGWDNKSKFKRTKQFCKHCFGKQSTLFKFKWLFCILVGSVASGLMVYMLLVRNEENVNTKDTFKLPLETNEYRRPYWAEATFCNVHQFSMEKVLELRRVAESTTDENYRYSAETNLSIIDAMCKYKDALETSSSSKFPPISPDVANYTYLMKFLEENTISCSQMFPACVYMGTVQEDCSHIIKPVDTIHGRCCRLFLAPAQPKFANSYFDKLADITEELNAGLNFHSQNHQYHKIENSSLLRRAKFNSSYFNVHGANLFEEISRYMQAFHFSALLNLNEDSYQCDKIPTSTNKILFSLQSPGKLPHVHDFISLNVANEEVVLTIFPEAVPSDSFEELRNNENRKCRHSPWWNWDVGRHRTTKAAYLDGCSRNFVIRNCKCALFGYYHPVSYWDPVETATCNTGSNCNDTKCLKKMHDLIRKTPGICSCVGPNCDMDCNSTAYNYTTTNQSMKNAAKLWASLRKFGKNATSAFPWTNNKTGIIHFVIGTSRLALISTNNANREVYLVLILITVVASLTCLSFIIVTHLWRCICDILMKRTLHFHGALHLRKT